MHYQNGMRSDRLKQSIATHHFDISSAQHHAIHLLQGQLCGLGDVVLHECEALVFLRDGIPGHVDGLDGAEGKEGLSYRVLLELETDAAYVYSGGGRNAELSNVKAWKEVQALNVLEL